VSRVGVVGAGRMGAPMVRRLANAGHQVTVAVRDAEKRSQWATSGVRTVASPAEAADGADVVVVCVFTDDQVRQVCLDDGLADAMTAGAVLVVHTTGSPDTVAAVAAAAPAIGVLDAPVSGGPHDIDAGTLTVFVGGDAATVDRARPVLSAYADPLLHVGALGAGQWVKLLNNTLFAAQLGMLRRAADFGRAVGVSEAGLLGALRHGSAASRAVELAGSRGSVAGFVDSVAEFLGKDVAVVRQVAAETGSDLGALAGLLDEVVPGHDTTTKAAESPVSHRSRAHT
jgi:3-hydroxyisobutyrate dehydrogenase